MKVEQIINNIMGILLLLLAVGAFIAAFFYGAYWHYYTAILCSGLSIVILKNKLD